MNTMIAQTVFQSMEGTLDLTALFVFIILIVVSVISSRSYHVKRDTKKMLEQMERMEQWARRLDDHLSTMRKYYEPPQPPLPEEPRPAQESLAGLKRAL